MTLCGHQGGAVMLDYEDEDCGEEILELIEFLRR
jgi:hypothetical protein